MRWTDWAEFSLFNISPPLHRHHEFIPLCIYSHILLLQLSSPHSLPSPQKSKQEPASIPKTNFEEIEPPSPPKKKSFLARGNIRTKQKSEHKWYPLG